MTGNVPICVIVVERSMGPLTHVFAKRTKTLWKSVAISMLMANIRDRRTNEVDFMKTCKIAQDVGCEVLQHIKLPKC